jgi:branched-chain amino acid transport system permease protein
MNLGVSAFFALGAYTTVALETAWKLPLPATIPAAAIVAGLVGIGMGYLTLRLKGIFFAIATLALAVVTETFITNWDYVGGSAGAYLLHPKRGPWFGSYIEYLFLLMLIVAALAVVVARAVERSWLGYGFTAIRDDETAAEATGVPTLRLKLVATGLSGALMGMAGAPLPYYVSFLEPASTFNLAYAVNTIAMAMIGGTTTWLGPLIGAVLLATVQQVATVTISSEINLMAGCSGSMTIIKAPASAALAQAIPNAMRLMRTGDTATRRSANGSCATATMARPTKVFLRNNSSAATMRTEPANGTTSRSGNAISPKFQVVVM